MQLIPMKNDKPGMIIKDTGSPSFLYDQLMGDLSGFYRPKGFVCVPHQQSFGLGAPTYLFTVYRDIPKYGIESKLDNEGLVLNHAAVQLEPAPVHIKLKLEYEGQERGKAFYPRHKMEADYPVTPSKGPVMEVFFLYFNTIRGTPAAAAQSLRERTEFISFMRGQSIDSFRKNNFRALQMEREIY